MGFFRRTFDASLALPREATPHDSTDVSRLLRDGAQRFFSAPHSDLPALLASAPAMLIEASGGLCGVAVAGWPSDGIVWLRGLALADGLTVSAGLDALLPPFHALLRAQQLRAVYYAGDAGADRWVLPALSARRYTRDTEVIVYEQRGLNIPTYGNTSACIRRAQPVDLPALLAMDHACFSAQWHKDEGAIGPALAEAPLFLVAEVGGAAVGYAFATKHFGGRLVHLVRIAVLPAYQRQALGVRLLAEVVAFARTVGADSITLNTQANNHTAQRLYERFGFQRTGERQPVLRFDL